MVLEASTIEDINNILSVYKKNYNTWGKFLWDMPNDFSRSPDRLFWIGASALFADNGPIIIIEDKLNWTLVPTLFIEKREIFLSQYLSQDIRLELNKHLKNNTLYFFIKNETKSTNATVILNLDCNCFLNEIKNVKVKSKIINTIITSSNKEIEFFLKKYPLNIKVWFSRDRPAYSIIIPLSEFHTLCKELTKIINATDFTYPTDENYFYFKTIWYEAYKKLLPQNFVEAFYKKNFKYIKFYIISQNFDPFLKKFIQLQKDTNNFKKLMSDICMYIKSTKRHLSTKTMHFINTGRIHKSYIMPHAHTEEERNEAYYRFRGQELFLYPYPVKKPPIYSLSFSNHDLPAGARLSQAVSMIEFLLISMNNANCPRPFRWLDLACGGGEIINFVNLDRIGLSSNDIEFIGIDTSPSEIKWANRVRQPGRKFYCYNIFNIPDFIRKKQYDILSAFEFLEHVIDPVDLLINISSLKHRFLVCGSPHNEIPYQYPDPGHAWRFDHRGYIECLQAAKYNCLYSSIINIGKYTGGLDWISVIGSLYSSYEKALSASRVNSFFSFKKLPTRINCKNNSKFVDIYGEVTNFTHNTLISLGNNLYKIGVQLYDNKNSVIKEFRYSLPKYWKKEQTINFAINIDLNYIKEGTYNLYFDIVNEHHFWFKEKGSLPFVITLTIY